MTTADLLASAWVKLRSKPWFVSAYSLFGGALAVQIQSMLSSGKVDWTLQGWAHTIGGALLATAYALAHLYLPAPPPQPTTKETV